MPETTTFKDRALQVLAILGLVAILLIGAWGIIQIAFALPGFFTNLGNGNAAQVSPQEHLSVSMPATITSGQPFSISWSHTGGTANYSYALSYSCATGLSVKAPLPTGATQSVPCDTPFNFTNAAQSVTLTPELTGSKQVSATFSVVSNDLSSGAITSSASSTTAVLPALSATKPRSSGSTSSAIPSSTYVAAVSPHATLYGLSDLAVQILSAPSPVNGRYTVEFMIQNVGTNVATGGWVFTVLLPLQPVYTYQSQPQQALYPGDKIIYTLGFNDTYNSGCGGYQYPYTGSYNLPCAYPSYSSNGNVFSVTVDPRLQESSYANSTASITLPAY